MANIKKVFQPLIDLLEANQGSKVKSILEQAIALAAAKTGGGGGAASYHQDESGNVVAIRCGYHKKWFSPAVVEFGKKTSTASGYSPMSKDGTNKWNAQNKAAKEAESKLLDRLQAGEITVEDIPREQELIAEQKATIVPLESGYGFDTLEECLADDVDARLAEMAE